MFHVEFRGRIFLGDLACFTWNKTMESGFILPPDVLHAVLSVCLRLEMGGIPPGHANRF